MKLLVLNNLSSGLGDGLIYDFIRSFSQVGDTVVVHSLDMESDFSMLADSARGFDAVVASGGDGTVSSICYLLRHSGVPILPFPSGTANLLTQNLLSPTEPFALAQQLRAMKTLDIDLAELELEGKRFGFTLMAGCGYDATIMKDAQPNKKRLGPLAYFKAALENPTPQCAQFTLTIDGSVFKAQGIGAVLMNFSRIQFDINLDTGSSPNDGLLDLMILGTKNAWELIPPTAAAAIDRSGALLSQNEQISYFRGKEIRIQAEPSLLVEYDGEPLQLHTPLTARILPGAARLIVSEEALEAFGEG